MNEADFDTTDGRIVHALQTDARRSTTASIGDSVGLSPSAVGKRIRRLEASGVIESYHTTVDYERAGFPLHVLFTCTAPIEHRSEYVEQTLDVRGVVHVRELMTGRENVHIEAVAEHTTDVTEFARELRQIGYDVVDETLIRDQCSKPYDLLDSNPTA